MRPSKLRRRRGSPSLLASKRRWRRRRGSCGIETEVNDSERKDGFSLPPGIKMEVNEGKDGFTLPPGIETEVNEGTEGFSLPPGIETGVNGREKVFSLPCGIKTEVNEGTEGFTLPPGKVFTLPHGFCADPHGIGQTPHRLRMDLYRLLTKFLPDPHRSVRNISFLRGLHHCPPHRSHQNTSGSYRKGTREWIYEVDPGEGVDCSATLSRKAQQPRFCHFFFGTAR